MRRNTTTARSRRSWCERSRTADEVSIFAATTGPRCRPYGGCYDGGGDPNKQNAAILNAIAYGANVIGLVAIDPNLVQSGIQAAKAAIDLIFPGHDILMDQNYPKVAEGVTRLV